MAVPLLGWVAKSDRLELGSPFTISGRKFDQMFGNTFVIPHADGNITAVKINQDGYASEYLAKASLYEVTVRVRHSKTKATAEKPAYDRHNVEIVQTVYEAAGVAEYQRKVYIVLESLPGDADVKLTDALADWLIATANSNVVSLKAWES